MRADEFPVSWIGDVIVVQQILRLFLFRRQPGGRMQKSEVALRAGEVRARTILVGQRHR